MKVGNQRLSIRSLNGGKRKLRQRLINPQSARDAHAAPPVFVDIEAVHFNVRRNAAREGLEGAMKTEQRCNEINQRRVIGNLSGAEQAGAGDAPSPVVCRDSSPVVAASLSTTLEDLRLKKAVRRSMSAGPRECVLADRVMADRSASKSSFRTNPCAPASCAAWRKS